MNLQVIADRVTACVRCGLCKTRTQAVTGDGAADAKIVLVGEAPGKDEDRTGRPFVGRAGKLLDKVLRKAGLSRGAVYITNIAKCRPPNNRKPEPGEIKACRRHLRREIRTLHPRVIIALGATSAQELCETAMPIGQMRRAKGWHTFVPKIPGIPVVPTWHPAYVLRNPAAKRELIADIKRAVQIARYEYVEVLHRRR